MAKNSMSKQEKMWQRQSDVSTINAYAQLKADQSRFKSAVKEIAKQQKQVSSIVKTGKK